MPGAQFPFLPKGGTYRTNVVPESIADFAPSNDRARRAFIKRHVHFPQPHSGQLPATREFYGRRAGRIGGYWLDVVGPEDFSGDPVIRGMDSFREKRVRSGVGLQKRMKEKKMIADRIAAIEQSSPYRRQRKTYVRARGRKLEQFSDRAAQMNDENRASANRSSGHPLVRGLQSLEDAISSGSIPEPFPEIKARAEERRMREQKSKRISKFRQHIFREQRVNRAVAARSARIGMSGAMGVIGAIPSIVHLARGGSLGSLAGPLPTEFGGYDPGRYSA